MKITIKGKRLFVYFFAVLLIIGTGGLGAAVFADEMNYGDYRIAGDDRYDTAFEIAKLVNTEPEKVIIVRGDSYEGVPQIVDGLTASFLAGEVNAPILLVHREQLPEATKNALKELAPSEAYIIGGINVISQEVEDAIKAMGIVTERIAGENRYETAAEIAMMAESAADNIGIITSGNDENLADSLTAGPLAFLGHPIFLVDNSREEVPDVTIDAMNELGIEELIIIGGTSAISKDLEDALDDLEGISVIARLAGDDRYETSIEVAKFAAFADEDHAYLVNGSGTGFVDAVAASTLGSPIVYFNSIQQEIPQVVEEHLRNISGFMGIGGESVATNAILSRAIEIVGVPLTMPRANVVFGMNSLHSEFWVPNSEVDIEITRAGDVVFSHKIEADEDGTFGFYPSTFDDGYYFMGGDHLMMMDHDEREVNYEILYIEVTATDWEENLVQGKAEPNETVEVYIDRSHQGVPFDEYPRLFIDADENGEWIADFTSEWDMSEDLFGGAIVSDEEENTSIYFWSTTLPAVGVFPNENQISGNSWMNEGEITIEVEGNLFTVMTDLMGNFQISQEVETNFTLEGGDVVTVSDGMTTYTFAISELLITNVDRTTGEISGTATTNSQVDIEINTPWMQPGGGPPMLVESDTLEVNDQGEWSFVADNRPIEENDNIYVTVDDETYGNLVRTIDKELGEYSGNP